MRLRKCFRAFRISTSELIQLLQGTYYEYFSIENLAEVANSTFHAVIINNRASVKTCEEAGDTSNSWGPEMMYVRDLRKTNFRWDLFPSNNLLPSTTAVLADMPPTGGTTCTHVSDATVATRFSLPVFPKFCRNDEKLHSFVNFLPNVVYEWYMSEL
jgi:hypothetical protein